MYVYMERKGCTSPFLSFSLSLSFPNRQGAIAMRDALDTLYIWSGQAEVRRKARVHGRSKQVTAVYGKSA